MPTLVDLLGIVKVILEALLYLGIIALFAAIVICALATLSNAIACIFTVAWHLTGCSKLWSKSYVGKRWDAFANRDRATEM